ncbi:Leucyl/phenylalanyl-tRNA--protein transferase [Vibrio aerogenes CECT 7868]|uniref:Leucyl/phenylalanyl-tRNA--protein transferase n=1 Tax=Vibrio aerogenes CECT 7868 TaxID=1216006 RepID=A0A1M6EIA5_9VIBR|nr:leucyl/phenylalanyl-tRNA--protein transferase [Vibrio aerogenes]SHI85008.1 Leucyl/phenylalanyl-tRNA--protein transferase [Vibrio aerogenes CECT 7868]
MTIYIPELIKGEYDFPSPEQALDEPNGLLAFGGDLHTSRLIKAYQEGIFPWYGPGEPILWWSPSPRAIFNPFSFKPAKSLRKFQKKVAYQLSINQSTPQVIDLCSTTRSPEQTWLNEEMRTAYKNLAQAGHCHSVEVWDNETLVGGLYGIAVGQLFCGESMFSLSTNASKVALWAFCQHFSQAGGQLIDCQIMNPHLASMGASELERESFISQLKVLRQRQVDSTCYQPQWISLITNN